MEPSIGNKIVYNLRQKYTHRAIEGDQRFVESVIHILRKYQAQWEATDRFLDEIVQMIYRNYRIREVSIGLLCLKDDAYRYVSFCGFRKEAEAALRKLSYRKEDFEVGKSISNLTWVFLSEEKSYIKGEESTFNRPLLLAKLERESIDSCLEGDYFDTQIYDRKNRMIGWIEYSGTQDYQFPDIHVIKEIELISLIISIALERS